MNMTNYLRRKQGVQNVRKDCLGSVKYKMRKMNEKREWCKAGQVSLPK
jgi:hypothetical protein